MTSSETAPRIASVMARKSSMAWLGVPSGRRAWMWIITPPSSTIRRASAADSAGVYGIAGHWSRLASAPEIAQVMMTGSSRLTRAATLVVDWPQRDRRARSGYFRRADPPPTSAERTSHDRSDHPGHRRRVPRPAAHAGAGPDGLLRHGPARPRRLPRRVLPVHRAAWHRRQRQVRPRRPHRRRHRRDDPAGAVPRVPRAAPRRPRRPLSLARSVAPAAPVGGG